MNKVDLHKNNSGYDYNERYGRTNDDYRSNDSYNYTRQGADYSRYDRPSNLNERKPVRQDTSYTLKDRLEAVAAQAAELQMNRESQMARRMTQMMELLPQNSYDAEWVNENTPDIKRIKMLMMISSCLNYGGTALGIGIMLFQKITSTYYDPDPSNNIWAGLIVVIGLAVYYGYMTGLNRKLKKCTVMVKGLIVSYKVSHSSDDSGTTYAPVFGFNFNGHDYTVSGTLYSSGMPKIGKEVNLYIDAKDPITYFQPQHDRSSLIFITLFSALFIGIGIMLLFV